MGLVVSAGFIAALVFIVSYIRLERSGLLILSLGVGYTMAIFWTNIITKQADFIARTFGIYPWYELVYASLVLIPAGLVLLLAERRSSFLLSRFTGSVIVSIFAVVLLLPVVSVLMIGGDETSRQLFEMISANQQLIITVILMIGLVDSVLARSPKGTKPTKG